jgi:hypothetical protein
VKTLLWIWRQLAHCSVLNRNHITVTDLVIVNEVNRDESDFSATKEALENMVWSLWETANSSALKFVTSSEVYISVERSEQVEYLDPVQRTMT